MNRCNHFSAVGTHQEAAFSRRLLAAVTRRVQFAAFTGFSAVLIWCYTDVARAAVILAGRSAHAGITGAVGSGTRLEDSFSHDDATFDLGSSNLSLSDSAMSGNGSVASRANESSRASVSGDSLSMSGEASTASSHDCIFCNTRAAAGTSFGFQITTPYRYSFFANFNIGGSNPVAPASGTVTLHGPTGTLFRKFSDNFGSDSEGHASGILAPGGYSVTANTKTEAGFIFGRQEQGNSNAGYSFAFRAVPVESEPHWFSPVSGSFQDETKWDPHTVPSASHTALFDVPGTYTVRLERDVTNQGLRANGAGVNVELDLADNTYTVDEINIGGQEGDDVTFTFADSGGIVVSAAAAAFAAGDGFAQPANGGPVRRLQNRLFNARFGGTANVTIPVDTLTGVIAEGGRANIRGAGDWNVGSLNMSAGTLHVSAGGKLQSDSARIGTDAGFVSTFTVTGPSSSWFFGANAIIGERGGAFVTFENGAVVTGQGIVIGYDAGSAGTINLDAAALSQISFVSTDDLTVGRGGTGTLNMIDGSLVDADRLIIGLDSTSVGTVTVNSNSELTIDDTLTVGDAGMARLEIDGGIVDRDGPGGFTKIGPRGLVLVRNGEFVERRELTVDGTLTVGPANGAVLVGQSGPFIRGRVNIGPGGTLKGTGVIAFDDPVVSGGVNQFGGTISTGNSPGTLTIDGDYEQTSGLLGIEIAGTAPGQFDVLEVTGDVSLGGELLLQFIDGFAPSAGDVFEFLDVDGALSGAFASVEVRGLLPGFMFDIRPEAGGLTMVALNDGVAVPEPASIAPLVTGMLAILFRKRYSPVRR